MSAKTVVAARLSASWGLPIMSDSRRRGGQTASTARRAYHNFAGTSQDPCARFVTLQDVHRSSEGAEMAIPKWLAGMAFRRPLAGFWRAPSLELAPP